MAKVTKPSLTAVANEYVRKWRQGNRSRYHVLDQLGGYATPDKLEIQYAEVAAVTAIMAGLMTAAERREFANELAEVAKLL